MGQQQIFPAVSVKGSLRVVTVRARSGGMKRTQNRPFFALSVSVSVAELVGPLLAGVARADGDLARQMRRATASISLNITEARARLGKDRRYLSSVAAGSARELDAALRMAIAFGYLTDDDCADALQLLDRQHALLWGLTRK